MMNINQLEFDMWAETEKGSVMVEAVIDNAIKVTRERLRENLDEGVTCPCCGQYAKRYKRKLNSSMAAALCWLWTHPKLAWWGFIEEKPKEEHHKGRTSGLWRVTQLGADFARSCVSVPRYAFVYNGTVEDFTTGDAISIRCALGDRFDYAELMGFNDEKV